VLIEKVPALVQEGDDAPIGAHSAHQRQDREQQNREQQNREQQNREQQNREQQKIRKADNACPARVGGP
jgi:hypothetical protein